MRINFFSIQVNPAAALLRIPCVAPRTAVQGDIPQPIDLETFMSYILPLGLATVSYTHLTLPTICSV